MSEDFGLLYRSTFSGSMVGTSPTVFAVWGYVVACGYGGQVDLNPRLLAAIFGTTVADVEAAIRVHCAPDPDSRTATDEGRRLRHVGGVSYEIVNHDVYKNARALEEKRSRDRARQRASRDKRRTTTDVPIFELSQKSVTERDPLLSSPSDLISSDPEGVQGEGDHGTPEPVPSKFAPKDYTPTERQRARCRELGHDVDKLLSKFRRTEFNRAYTDWELRFDGWIEDEPAAAPSSPKRAPKPPPPWIDESGVLFAREHGLNLERAAREFRRRGIPPDPGEARVAFRQLLRERAAAIDGVVVPAIAAA